MCYNKILLKYSYKMKTYLLIVAALLAVTNAATIKTADPEPEKPNQYHRICDHVSPQNEGC